MFGSGRSVLVCELTRQGAIPDVMTGDGDPLLARLDHKANT